MRLLNEIEVPKSNLAAIQFYNRHRFRIANVLPKFHTDEEDGFEMRQPF